MSKEIRSTKSEWPSPMSSRGGVMSQTLRWIKRKDRHFGAAVESGLGEEADPAADVQGAVLQAEEAFLQATILDWEHDCAVGGEADLPAVGVAGEDAARA